MRGEREEMPVSRSLRKILHLNLHREYFTAIVAGRKRIEYRKQSPYWRKRLEDREYDGILFRNGYARDAPEMLVEFRGLRRYGKGPNAYYAIRLGKIFTDQALAINGSTPLTSGATRSLCF